MLLCCFVSVVKYNLFHAYCTSYYGYELWSLSNSNVKEFCVAWRKSLRRMWGLPFQTHGVLSVATFVSMPWSRIGQKCRRYLNLLIVFDMILLLFNLLLCTDCTLVVVHFWTHVQWLQWNVFDVSQAKLLKLSVIYLLTAFHTVTHPWDCQHQTCGSCRFTVRRTLLVPAAMAAMLLLLLLADAAVPRLANGDW